MKNILTFLFILTITHTLLSQQSITKEVGDFHELKVYDLIEVNLIQSNENKVVIKGDDTGDVVVVNKDGKLKLRMESDKVFHEEGVTIVTDVRSLLYLMDMTLDFSDGINGKGFQFSNPNASRTCGCGESFSL